MSLVLLLCQAPYVSDQSFDLINGKTLAICGHLVFPGSDRGRQIGVALLLYIFGNQIAELVGFAHWCFALTIGSVTGGALRFV